MRPLTALLALLVIAPLAAGQTPAPIEGDREDLNRFAGEWVGGYSCEETGRHGTIVFRLAAGADTVAAAVLMVPRATERDLVPEAVPLAVHRVTVEGRTLRGVLARYDDPEWEMPLETSFIGTLSADGHRIEGTFQAEGTIIDTIPQSGRWWVIRGSETASAQIQRASSQASRPSGGAAGATPDPAAFPGSRSNRDGHPLR